jgi:protease-4
MADASFYKGTLDKLKIHADMEHIGAYKSASEQWTRDSMSDAQRRATDSILDSIYGQIVGTIAESRKLTPAQVRSAIDKGLLTPEEAKSTGMVDGLLYDDEVESELKKKFGDYTELRIRAYKKSGSWPARRNRIAVISASGAIISGKGGTSSFGGEFIGSDSLCRTLREVREDRGIRAAVLRVDSPGGSGVASDAIWREVELLKEEKPLIVSMGDVAASGGYYISMGADAIVAEPATITGSIGVISGKYNLRGFYEGWIGLHRDQIKRGENADLFTDYQGFTEAQRAIVRAQIETFYREFVHKAATGRGKKDEEIDRIAQGRIWTGAQAKENGLVDELGGLDTAVEIAKKKAGLASSESVTLESYPRRKGLFQSLSGDDQVFAPKVRIPGSLMKTMADLDLRERLAQERILLWAGSF